MMSHRNLLANFKQLMSGYFADRGGVAPSDLTIVSWLPFYHDMGLFLESAHRSSGDFGPRSPARWRSCSGRPVDAVDGEQFSSTTAAPNFAYDCGTQNIGRRHGRARSGGVHSIISGSERVTRQRCDASLTGLHHFDLPAKALRPSYGLAEATVYVATSGAGAPPKIVHFDSDKLSAGHAERCPGTKGTPLVSYSASPPAVRIVDPETQAECPDGTVVIWVCGDNVSDGYWNRPDCRPSAPSAERSSHRRPAHPKDRG